MGSTLSFISSLKKAFTPKYTPVTIGTFAAILLIPMLVSMLAGSMGMIVGFGLIFLLNWGVNIASNYYHYYTNCKGEKTANAIAMAGFSIAGSVASLVLSIVIMFIPVLKMPLMIFDMVGLGFLVNGLVNVIANYNPFFLIATSLARAAILKKSCKKKKSEE